MLQYCHCVNQRVSVLLWVICIVTLLNCIVQIYSIVNIYHQWLMCSFYMMQRLKWQKDAFLWNSITVMLCVLILTALNFTVFDKSVPGSVKKPAVHWLVSMMPLQILTWIDSPENSQIKHTPVNYPASLLSCMHTTKWKWTKNSGRELTVNQGCILLRISGIRHHTHTVNGHVKSKLGVANYHIAKYTRFWSRPDAIPVANQLLDLVFLIHNITVTNS